MYLVKIYDGTMMMMDSMMWGFENLKLNFSKPLLKLLILEIIIFYKEKLPCVIFYFQIRRRRSELFRANSTQARCVVASYEGNMEMINTYLY